MTENEVDEEELELEDYREDKEKIVIQTHERISQDLCGEVIEFKQGYVELRLTTSPEMVADDMGLIHGGFIFSAADYAAMLAVNERNVVLVASDCQFLSPVKLHDKIHFTASICHKEGRNRNVHVEGFVLDIKVFKGEFKTVITKRNVLKLKLLDKEESESGTPVSIEEKS